MGQRVVAGLLGLLIALSIPSAWSNQTVHTGNTLTIDGTTLVYGNGVLRSSGATSGFNVQTNYGAKGDAVTDDAPAIQAAFSAVPVGGQQIVFPCGNYSLGSPIVGNGFPVDIVFAGAGCVVFAQMHTGTAITLPQADLAYKITISGNAMFVAGAASAVGGALAVSFPVTTSFDRPTFDMKGVISCVSQTGNVTAPYPQTYTNCLTLSGSWYGEARIWFAGPATSTGIPVAGTSAITLGEGTYGLRIPDLFSIWADQAVWLKGYTEGISLDDPVDAGSNFGVIRVGSASVDATGAYVGSSGITPHTGILANQITITGGSSSGIRGCAFFDHMQFAITKGFLCGSSISDGINPWLGIVLNSSYNSSLDGVWQDTGVNLPNDIGVFLTWNSGTATTNNRITGTFDTMPVAVKAVTATSANYADIITKNVVADFSNAGTGNAFLSCQSPFVRSTAGCVQTQVASNSSSLDFTGLNATYGTLHLDCHGVTPVNSGADVMVRVGTGGTPTWQTSGYQYSAIYNLASTATPAGVASASDSGINLGALGLSSDPANLTTFRANFSDLATTGFKMIDFVETGWTTGGGSFRHVTGSGTWTATTAITGIRFMMGGGNIAAGTCTLVGHP
jgi:hypothetical protein